MHSRFSKRKTLIRGLSAVLVAAVALVTWGRQDDSTVTVETQVFGAQVVQANGNGNGNNGNGNGNGGGNGNGSFSVAGQVQGLYPGAVVPLPLTLNNSNSFGIQITKLTVTVQTPVPASVCTAGAIEVGVLAGNGQFTAQNPISVDVTLGKNASGSLPSRVQLHMLASSPDACQGASFDLSYGGSAVKS